LHFLRCSLLNFVIQVGSQGVFIDLLVQIKNKVIKSEAPSWLIMFPTYCIIDHIENIKNITYCIYFAIGLMQTRSFLFLFILFTFIILLELKNIILLIFMKHLNCRMKHEFNNVYKIII
jgi:hypothetical protein